MIDMCGECIEKKEEQREFKFSELSDKAKAYAVYEYIKNSHAHVGFYEAWGFHKDNEHEWVFDEEGWFI